MQHALYRSMPSTASRILAGALLLDLNMKDWMIQHEQCCTKIRFHYAKQHNNKIKNLHFSQRMIMRIVPIAFGKATSHVRL